MQDQAMSRIFVLGVLAAGLGLAACSSVPYALRLSERQAAFAAAAGAPVNSFRFYNSLWSWEPLGRDQLVVYTRPQQAFLLDAGGCLDLEYTNAIGLTSSFGEVSVGFDKLLTGRRDMPCTITRIRPIDVKRLKATREQQRKIETEPRSATSVQ
jgi:hypothetical protein